MKKTILFFIITLTSLHIHAQSIDTVIINAMQDEIGRNMKELSMEDYEKPFFIAFLVGDVQTLNIASVLGSTISSIDQHNRTWTNRVMVGSYKLNDENYNSRSYNYSTDVNYLDIPIENDYYGIRRAVWIAVNNVYKSAARKFKSKVQALERNNINPDSLQLDDFSKAPIEKIHIKAPNVKINQQKYEKLTNALSGIFKQYPQIENSGVSMAIYSLRIYFVNSEGTSVSFPVNLTSLNINASALCKDGITVSDNMNYICSYPNSLPSLDSLKKETHLFAGNIMKRTKAPVFRGKYEGPVLVEGNNIASIFVSSMFMGEDGLVAYREPLTLGDGTPTYFRFVDQQEESKINRKIMHESFTALALPKLHEYQGKKLIGAIEVDAEGVIPPDTIKLIENGRIKTMLCDRTPTREVKASNGHLRPIISGNEIARETGPSVIKITTKNTMSNEQLKKKLIEEAKEEGLEYAIYAKPINVSATVKPVNYYKLNLETGEEQLLRDLYYNSYNAFDLEDILGVSSKEVVVNNILSFRQGGYQSQYGGISGIPYSMICPGAILFEELEMEGSRIPFSADLPIMPSPLKEQEKTGQ